MRHLPALLLVAGAAVAQGARALDADQVFGADAAKLAAAAEGGDVARVRALAMRSDPNARGRDGTTLLQWALLGKSVAGLQALLAAGADPAQPGVDGATVVHMAAAAEDSAYLHALLAAGADPNVRHGRSGATPLMAALMARRAPQLRLLLDAGADLAVADAQGDTALHVAAKINDAAAVLQLLQAGADPRAVNRRGIGFQRYLAMTPERVLSADERARRQAVHDWLAARGHSREAR